MLSTCCLKQAAGRAPVTTQSAMATSLPLARSVISFSCSIRISSFVFAAALKVLRVQPASRVSRTSSTPLHTKRAFRPLLDSELDLGAPITNVFKGHKPLVPPAPHNNSAILGAGGMGRDKSLLTNQNPLLTDAFLGVLSCYVLFSLFSPPLKIIWWRDF